MARYPDNSDARRWFVAQTQPLREALAEANLTRQGYEVFHPVIKRTIRHARQFHQRQMSLFPRYLFVRFDPGKAPWRSINGTLGVAALLTMAGQPAEVPDLIVEELAKLYGTGAGSEGAFSVGDRVRLMAGPFAGVLATVSKLDGRGRIEVLFEMLGMSVSAKVDTTNSSPLPVAV